MSLFEITLVVEAPELSTAVGRLLYDEDGEPYTWLRSIRFVEAVDE